MMTLGIKVNTYFLEFCGEDSLKLCNDEVEIRSQNILGAVLAEIDERCTGVCLNAWDSIVVHYEQQPINYLINHIKSHH